MMLEKKIEAILFYKNEPVSIVELSKLLGEEKKDIRESVNNLQKELEGRGVVLVTNDDEVSLGTHPDFASLIEGVQKEEFSRDLGRAGLETLAVVLYKGPVSRREIDYIRGVNSSYILRSLLIRGLVEKDDDNKDGRSFNYKPSLKLLEHLGITKQEYLPEYETAFKKIGEFVKAEDRTEKND